MHGSIGAGWWLRRSCRGAFDRVGVLLNQGSADVDDMIRMRPAQALRLWHLFGLERVRAGEIDLSNRQMVVLLSIYLEPPPHTVRGLAEKLRVTKPVITRALDAMSDLDLVARRRDPADRRNVLIQRTVKGALYVDHLGDRMVAAGELLSA
jgi:DNA-binding MarR family transcriptional regulator